MSIERGNSYDWQRPLLMALVPVVIVVLFVLISYRNPVGVMMILFVSIIVAFYSFMIWVRTKSRLRVEDNGHLNVRRRFAWVDVDPASVRAVKYVFNGRSPDFVLKRQGARNVYVPTSRLVNGHSTLFAWLSGIDDLHYDDASLKILDRLKDDGLL